MRDEIVIVSAARTAVGSFMGGLSKLPAHDLGAAVITEVLSRAKLSPDQVDEVILGQILTAAQGQNPARQAAIKAGIPVDKTALSINYLCGSGLRSVALGMQAILAGDANIIVVGGQESMSRAPHAMLLREPTKMGDGKMVDTMVQDGLMDAFNNYHMGITAENVAAKFSLTREMQDAFALSSQQKAVAAQAAGKFAAEIVPVKIADRKGEIIIDKDEQPRADTTAESLAKLKPAFKGDGTVTAGNASSLNDGAAAVVIMTASNAAKLGLTPLARIMGWATAGVDPSIMGTGPIPAVRKLMQKLDMKVTDFDRIEANEAFAAQALSVNLELGLDVSKVNVNGGAIALGHPIGASGARVLVTLLHELQRENLKRGFATLCIGGGMGIALAVER